MLSHLAVWDNTIFNKFHKSQHMSFYSYNFIQSILNLNVQTLGACRESIIKEQKINKKKVL